MSETAAIRRRVKRRFLLVGDRRVHYLRAGEGPPVVLVHSSPANAWLLMKEIVRLAEEYTVFAFDTPGYGLSDALAGDAISVPDLADAMAQTLAAIRMPPCPVFGTHTGAAIALEFGVRYPERVTGLVLDGVPAFTVDERAAYFQGYFRRLPIDDLGGQYTMAWTRFRDQSIWFPWRTRTPDTLNAYDLATPASTHLWVSMYFQAADRDMRAYEAASHYGDAAIAAAAALNPPAIFTAVDTDMLYPHLARLPPLKFNQEIRRVGPNFAAKREAIAEGFARFGSAGAPPADRDEVGSSAVVARQFIEAGAGQVHVRYAGDRAAPPLLLIHDAPGSSEQWEELILALSAAYYVVAPDMPGNGESDRFTADAPTIEDFASTLLSVLDYLGLDAADIYGIGFGASAAIAFAHDFPERTGALCLRGVALPSPQERIDLRARLAPPIEIEPDGAHWYRTWLMLRDSKVYWPWYDCRLAAQRRVAADFSAERLHRWTMDVMRKRDSYHHLINAALDFDAAAALTGLAAAPFIVRDPQIPLSVYDDRLAALSPDAIHVSTALELSAPTPRARSRGG